VDEYGASQQLARLIGLPSWAPRAIKNATAFALVAVLVLSPSTFTTIAGLAAERITQKVTTLLLPEVTDERPELPAVPEPKVHTSH
jgi:hypothetical protein